MQRNPTLTQVYNLVTDLSELTEQLEDTMHVVKNLETEARGVLDKAEFNVEYLHLVYKQRIHNGEAVDTLESQMT